MLLGSLILAAATTTLRPVAQWDVVPYQRVAEPFKAGVVAFYDQPFKVEFSVDGKTVATVNEATLNDRTKVTEHWFTLEVAKLKDGPIALGAKVVANDGTAYELPPLPLYANAKGTLGSKQVVWLDPKDGIDYSEGTKERPVKSLKQAIARAGDGGTVYLMKPGVYRAERLGANRVREYWTLITPAPGLTLKEVKIRGGRTGCDKLRFKDVQLFCEVTGGQGFLLAGADANSLCWLDGCRMYNKSGRSAAMTLLFGNKLTGYVTGGATTEMGTGPCCKLLRNHVIKNISADGFSMSDGLAVNCRLAGLESSGVVDEPVVFRSQPLGDEWFHDVILANITATGCWSNGFMGTRLKDSVFSNVSVECVGDAKRYVSRFKGEMQNVWFDRVTVTGQTWSWFKSTNRVGDFAPTDVRVTGCSFKLPTEDQWDF